MNILVGLDASDRAPAVLAAARARAQSMGTKLLLVRAVMPIQLPPGMETMAPLNLVDRIIEDAQEDLRKLEASLPEHLRGGTEVCVGAPWEVVLDVARSADAAMIVIGSHGFEMVDRLLGTTAARIVNTADRPVLVVRSDASSGETARVVVGVAADESARTTLTAAARLVSGTSAKLILVRAVEDLARIPVPELMVSLRTLTTEVLQRSREDLVHLGDELAPDLVDSIHVSTGTPWRELCSAANVGHASTIVIGAHRHGGLARMLGTTAARVVNHAPCSVLVVPVGTP